MKLSAVAAVIALAAPAAAQPVDSFTELEERVDVGRDVVVITSPDGEVFAGPLVDISPGSLGVLAGGRRVDLDETRVRRVQQDWDDSILEGVGLGAVVGLAPAMLAAFLGTGEGDFNGSGVGALMIMPIIVGGAIGAVLDISHTERGRDLYRSGRRLGVARSIKW